MARPDFYLNNFGVHTKLPFSLFKMSSHWVLCFPPTTHLFPFLYPFLPLIVPLFTCRQHILNTSKIEISKHSLWVVQRPQYSSAEFLQLISTLMAQEVASGCQRRQNRSSVHTATRPLMKHLAEVGMLTSTRKPLTIWSNIRSERWQRPLK